MSVKNGQNDLRFACECVSAKKGGYSEPWAAIAKHKLLQDGTKENILNLVAQEAKSLRFAPTHQLIHHFDQLLRP